MSNTNGYAEPPGPADTWLKTRNRYAPPQSEIHPVRAFHGKFAKWDWFALGETTKDRSMAGLAHDPVLI